MLKAISPIDGRYSKKTSPLSKYFSEYALIKYRVFVELQYFKALIDIGNIFEIEESKSKLLDEIFTNFSIDDAQKIKDIESITNHDVKAVEYFLRNQFNNIGLAKLKEFIHFGLTSQDINNTAFPLMLKDANTNIYSKELKNIRDTIFSLAKNWQNIPMLARTHGQPATPTTLGKEMMVFVYRLDKSITDLKNYNFSCKFGGATGNFNAHHIAYPNINWLEFGDNFCKNSLGLNRQQFTTQIDSYDDFAKYFQILKRINTILIDFARDIWTYISIEYFKQKTLQNEVGSSAMPHKVNPIDFENAEGNFGISNAILTHFIDKLPISRLQRDLTDSTVLRNIGVPLGHISIALSSLSKGISKLMLNEAKINQDLLDNWIVTSEALQTILRKSGIDHPYDAIKKATRGKKISSAKDMEMVIDQLDIDSETAYKLKKITPFNYIGIIPEY